MVESLLTQVDSLRDFSRRARRLALTLSLESDQRRLVRYADELEESADRMEKEVVDAKTMTPKLAHDG